MKRMILAAAAALAIAPAFAQPIDGDLSNLPGPFTSQTVDGSFGNNNSLLNLRVGDDGTYLYVGLAARIEGTGAPGTRGLWIVVGSPNDSHGSDTISGAGTVGGGGLNGVVMESGFDPDYVFYLQNGDGGNRQNYHMNVATLASSSDTYYGFFDVDANSFSPSGSEPVGFLADVDNSEATATGSSGAAGVTTGVEMRIPFTALNIASGNTINIFVGGGDGGNAYFSNQTLPTCGSSANLGGGAGNGTFPDFNANTLGAFAGGGASITGSQIYSHTLNGVVPVELSAFDLE